MEPGQIERVADALYYNVYEAPFRGKRRGRFCLTRDQLRAMLEVERLHTSTVRRLQDAALDKGLVVVDLDDVFPCIETRVLRGLRRPPARVLQDCLGEPDD